MKKKVISLFVTGMLAVSMIAGCGSDNTAADTNTSADTTADASTDAADTTAEETPAATADFGNLFSLSYGREFLYLNTT